jgi:hypothetical protein
MFMKLFAFVLLSVALLGVPSAYAQTPTETWNSELQEVPQAFTILADVDVADVVLEKNEESYTGSFAMRSNMGLQNDIVYGIVVYDTKTNSIVDLMKIGEEPALYEGEIKRYNFSYSTPKWLVGEVTVALQAFTKGGLALGTQILGTQDMTEAKTFLKCTTEKTISCVPEADAKLSIFLVSGNYFSNPVQTVEKVAVKNSRFELSSVFTNINPGGYLVIAENIETKEKVIVPYTVEGEYLEIQNIAASELEDGKIRIVGSVWGSMFEGDVNLIVKDENGNIESETSTILNGVAFGEDISTKIREGVVIATVMSKTDKTILATKEVKFSLRTPTLGDETGIAENSVLADSGVAPINSPQKSLLLIVIPILILIVLIGGWVMLRRQKANESEGTGGGLPLVGLLFFLLFSGGAQSAEAITINNYIAGPPSGGATYICNSTVTTNNLSYAPGEAMSVTINGTLSYAGGLNRLGSCMYEVPTNVNDSAPAYNVDFGDPYQILNTGAQTTPFPFLTTRILPAAPTVPGSHFLRIKQTIFDRQGSLSPAILRGGLPFTVNAPVNSQTFRDIVKSRFDLDGTFTVPAGVNQITVTASAGGGAGGAYFIDSTMGTKFTGSSGGSGGNIKDQIFAVTPGQVINIRVGSGAGFDVWDGTGDGEDTVIGTLQTLTGGKSSCPGTSGSSCVGRAINGGVGGLPNGVNGIDGQATLGWPGELGERGAGNTVGGSGGRGGFCTPNLPYTPGFMTHNKGQNGTFGGGGGGSGYQCDGSFTQGDGGNGGDGFVSISWSAGPAPTLTSFSIDKPSLLITDTFTWTFLTSGTVTARQWYITGPVNVGSAAAPLSLVGPTSWTGGASSLLGGAAPNGTYTAYLRVCNGTSCSGWRSDTFEIVTATPSVNLNFIN